MAMMEYAPEAYNSLLSLHEANHILQDKGGEGIITGPIRDIFLRHEVHKIYGLALLHKHFQIPPTNRLVDVRNVSTPWELGTDTQPILKKYNGVVSPRSLRLLNGEWQPYEFGFGDDKPLERINEKFSQDFLAYLEEKKMDQLLGLRLLETYHAEVSIEITEGNSNIMLPRGAVDEQQLITALWVFGPGTHGRCHCREYCYKDATGKHTGSNHGCG